MKALNIVIDFSVSAPQNVITQKNFVQILDAKKVEIAKTVTDKMRADKAWNIFNSEKSLMSQTQKSSLRSTIYRYGSILS